MAHRTFTRALVTGASSGIGEQFARQLSAQGVELVLVARRTDRLQALAADLPGGAEVLTADLTDPADLLRVANRLEADPPVDLLVNNAGFGNGRPFAAADLADELAQVQIHIEAVMTLTQAALRAMHAGAGGGILNVSSMAGFQPLPSAATYAACKAFMTSFTESVRLEELDRGVHLTALCPGFTDTAMVAGDPGLAKLPKRLLLTAEAVAREGLEGVAANKAVVVPGAAWKAASALTGVMPRGATRAVLTGARRLR